MLPLPLPLPRSQAIRDHFEENRRVLYIDVFYTSQMCHRCHTRLSSVLGKPRDKECGTCGVINRDKYVG